MRAVDYIFLSLCRAKNKSNKGKHAAIKHRERATDAFLGENLSSLGLGHTHTHTFLAGFEIAPRKVNFIF